MEREVEGYWDRAENHQAVKCQGMPRKEVQ